jgi:peptide/nickel transport system permease protein
LFGTDQFGRDVLSRVITGARNILIIVPLAVILSTVLGTALGLIMGYFRGLVDESIARVLEAFLALPLIVIALTAITAIGASNLVVILVIAVVFTPLIARTVRTSVLLERELDYVAAARLRGEKSPYIMFVEILPNVMAPIIVEFTVRIGYAVFAVATLSFLGFGVQPPAPDWAADIAANYTLVAAGYWWEVLFAALALASLVIGINLIADAVEGAIDQ